MVDKIEELLMLARLGDENALTTIMTSFKPLVSSIARKFEIAGEEIDDIIQEGSIGLYKAILSYDKSKNDNFDAYTAVIIKRQILNALNSSETKKNLHLNQSVPMESDSEGISNIPDPEETLLKDYEFKDIDAKIKNLLSNFEYSVYRLYIDGYTYLDIAGILGVEAKKVDNALTRVKSKLREVIGGEK